MMAKYFGLCQNPPGSERKLAEALRRLLDPWVILHGVSWQSLRDGREGDGEADFVLLHPHRGAIVIEVKGGIELNDGRWTTRTWAGQTKPINNPFDQATKSKHTLIRWAKAHGWNGLGFGHAVCFPDLDEVPDLGPAASPADVPEDLLFPIGSLAEWNAVLQNVLGNAWNAMLDSGGRRIGIRGGLGTRSQGFLRISDAGAGLGIALAEAKKLFEPFERRLIISEDLRSMALGGQGLGLAIVRMMATRRGVEARFVEPEPSFATTFEMTWRD